MSKTIVELEKERDGIYQQMSDLGDFRPGMISVNYRKCGKENCVCAAKEHPGHGPQYLWNTTQSGKSRAKNLRFGPELKKAEEDIANYKKFGQLCKEVIFVNEALCLLRPVPLVHEEDSRETLKKKLKKKYFKK